MFTLRVRFIDTALQIMLQVTVPQIFLAPVTLPGLSFAVELLAIPAGCWLLLRSDEQLTKLSGVCRTLGEVMSQKVFFFFFWNPSHMYGFVLQP